MHAHIVPKSTYYPVAASLGVLLVLTVVIADYNLGVLNTPIAVAIAIVKAVLIVLFFMHVRYGSPLLRVFAAGGFMWLVILFALTFSDYISRDTTAATPGELRQTLNLNPPPHDRD